MASKTVSKKTTGKKPAAPQAKPETAEDVMTPDDWSGSIERFERDGGPLFRKVAELAKELDTVPGAPHQAMARVMVIAGLAAMHSRTVAEAYSVGGTLLTNLGSEALMTRIELGREKSRGLV